MKKRKIVDKLSAEVREAPTNGFVLVDRFYSDDLAPKSVEPGCVVVLDHRVELYRQATDDELAKADKSAAAKKRHEEKRRAEDDARALAEAERATAHERRDEFVRDLIGRKTFKPAERAAIVGAMARTLMTGGLSSTYGIRETLGYDGKDWALADEWRVEQGITPEAALVVALHVSVGPLKWGGWEKVGTNRAAQTLYTLLGALGMVLSDVERSRVFPAAEDAS